MNKIRVVSEKRIHDIAKIRTMEYENFTISVESELQAPHSKSIMAVNHTKTIEVQRFSNPMLDYPAHIQMDATLSLEELPLFQKDLEDARWLLSEILHNEDFFFREEDMHGR